MSDAPWNDPNWDDLSHEDKEELRHIFTLSRAETRRVKHQAEFLRGIKKVHAHIKGEDCNEDCEVIDDV